MKDIEFQLIDAYLTNVIINIMRALPQGTSHTTKYGSPSRSLSIMDQRRQFNCRRNACFHSDTPDTFAWVNYPDEDNYAFPTS
jgi:hypothetical protein